MLGNSLYSFEALSWGNKFINWKTSRTLKTINRKQQILSIINQDKESLTKKKMKSSKQSQNRETQT